MPSIKKICEDHNLILCEDSAQGLGAKDMEKQQEPLGHLEL